MAQLYTLPTAVRTLALFYNKDLMAPPASTRRIRRRTLEELAQQAVQVHQAGWRGQLRDHGLPSPMTGQAHHWFREVLLRQFGQQPYSDDYTQVLWNASQGGYDAWNELLKFQTELKTGDATLFDGDPNFFLNGKVVLPH
jgi:multiple sugar transport system substrate-binding protein